MSNELEVITERSRHGGTEESDANAVSMAGLRTNS